MPTFETDVAPRRKSSVRYVHTVATTTLVQLGSIIFSQTNGAPELVAKCDQLLHAGCTGLAWFVQRRPSGNPKDAVPRRIGEMSLGLWPLASSPLASLPHGDCRPGASEVAFPGSLSLPLRDSEWFYFVESARLRGASDRGFGFSFAIVVAINLPAAQVAIGTNKFEALESPAHQPHGHVALSWFSCLIVVDSYLYARGSGERGELR